MEIFELILSPVSFGLSWFLQVFDAAGYVELFFGMTFITILCNRLLFPLLRSSGSDRARRSSGKDDSNE